MSLGPPEFMNVKRFRNNCFCFSVMLRRLGRSTVQDHMQSARACAAESHFLFICVCETCQNMQLCVRIGDQLIGNIEVEKRKKNKNKSEILAQVEIND